MSELSILNKTKGKVPTLPILSLRDEILGKNYELSVAYVGKNESRKINLAQRGKDYPTNILSFSLSKKSGELIICPDVVRAEAKNFEKNYKNFLGFLLIHGMLHLKGMEHGSIMDKAENFYDKKYFSRDRRGHQDDAHSSGRVSKRNRAS